MFEVSLSGTLDLADLYSIPLSAGAVYVVEPGSEEFISVDSVTGVVTPVAEGTGVVLIQDSAGTTWQRVFVSVLSNAESEVRENIDAGTASFSVTATVQQEVFSSMTVDIGFLGGHRLIHDSVADVKLKQIVSANKVANSATSATAENTALAIVARNLDGDFSANMITLTGLPTQAGHVATKSYVDNVAQGLDVKASVRAATTAAITLSGPQTIDGVALVAGDRVLVKNQADASANGIYVVAADAWSRAADANSNDKVTAGMFVFVEEGALNADSGFVLTADAPVVLGTTELDFTQFSGVGSFAAGDGLLQAGTSFSVVAADGTIVVDETGVKVGEIFNANVAAAADISWTKISKVGSSLADLATRSASDLNSGTLDDARLTANVMLRDAAQSVSGIKTFEDEVNLVLDEAAVDALRVRVAADSHDRFLLDSNGYMYFGTGAAPADIYLYRDGAQSLKVTGDFKVGEDLDVTGDVIAASFSGTGTNLTDLDAAEITIGFVDPARLQNIADAQISATADIAWSKLSKVGSSLADLTTRSAADLSSGILNDARLSSNVPLKDAATNVFTGAMTAASFSGDGSALTALNADQLTTGTVPLDRLVGITNTQISATADIAWSKISKVGSSLADLSTRSAADLSSGTLNDARLSSNVPLKDAGSNIFTGDIQAVAFAGDGSALTDLDAAEITTGFVDPARLQNIADAQIAANAEIADSKLATISSAGKVANSATTGTASDVADTLVLRDANGRAKFAAPSASADAATKGYVDDKEIRNETPTGTVDGTNLVFTLAQSPMSGTVQVFVSGLMMLAGTHYSMSGTTLTFIDPYQPITGEWVRVSYRKA